MVKSTKTRPFDSRISFLFAWFLFVLVASAGFALGWGVGYATNRGKKFIRGTKAKLPYDPSYYVKVGGCTMRYVHRNQPHHPSDEGEYATYASSHASSSRICLCEVHVGEEHARTYAPMLETKRAYAKRHGYDYVILETSPYPEVHPTCLKMPLMRYLMETTDHEWYVMVDSDTVVLNAKRSLTPYLDPNSDFVFHITERGLNPEHCDDTRFLQASMFAIRNGALGKSFLDEVWHSICTETLPFNVDRRRTDWGDQSHVQKIAQKLTYAPKCTYHAGDDFQCVCEWTDEGGSKRCATVRAKDGTRPLFAHPIKSAKELDTLIRSAST